MERTHSLVPIGHFTTGLTDDELRGLAKRHEVEFEVRSHQVVRGGEIQNHGWEIDLQGQESPADSVLPADEAHHHVHDVLHAIARAVIPEEDRPNVDVKIEHYKGSVYFEPKKGMAEYVRLRMIIEPETALRMSLLSPTAESFKDEIRDRLEALGLRGR